MGKKKEGGTHKKKSVRPTIARYHTDKTREKHKLKHVLASSGVTAAKAYADLTGLGTYLRNLPAYLKHIHPQTN